MAKNFVAKGDVITIPAPADTTGGEGVLIGALFGVALSDAAEGTDLVLQLVGAWDLPAATAPAIAVGDALYWDGSTVTTTADDNALIGAALSAKGAGVGGTVTVRLAGGCAMPAEEGGG